MTCSTCGRACALMVVVVPNLGWYWAPLYHFVDPKTMDGEPFCRAECALAWRALEQVKSWAKRERALAPGVRDGPIEPRLVPRGGGDVLLGSE